LTTAENTIEAQHCGSTVVALLGTVPHVADASDYRAVCTVI
jgi:hypothetical protein